MDEKIRNIALQTLDIEIEALLNLKNSVNADFIGAVKAIFKGKGRVVVTGIGKSAIVAQKIVATMNSTGTAALFMHAADAIHGDLGMIRQDDIIICISKSGDTPEIKVLVPILKNFGNPLIAMVANQDSFLAKASDYLLLTPIGKEADPNNLAPTASTTAQMSMGDALAISLLALRGFSSSDFAQFHPGGALGKQLYLRVSDIYTQHQSPSVLANASVQSTIVEMTTKRLGAVAVLDANRHVIGIITDGDLRRMLEKKDEFSSLNAETIMSQNPVTLQKDELAIRALELMRNRSISQLIIVDDSNLYLGMVHIHDLLREGIV
ncbi:MAG: KpsF/GutQ family sugar-phosphate isomerase [Saprospiraceae bacterium]